jgi:hypothetical protein
MSVKIEELKIGQRVHDHATKSNGIITARCDHIDGYSQFVVQMQETEGKIPEAYALDWQSFEIIDEELVKNTVEPETHSLHLGDKVESIDTGLKGIVVRFWTYVNGCVHAAIALPPNKHGEAQEAFREPVCRLKLIKATAVPVAPREKKAGPATRMGG